MLSKNIKRVIDKWGMKQTKFAELFTNMNRGKISSYCTGVSEPPILFMIELSEYTDLEIKRLYFGDIDFVEIPGEPIKKGERKTDSAFESKPKVFSGSNYLEDRVLRLEQKVAELDKKISK